MTVSRTGLGRGILWSEKLLVAVFLSYSSLDAYKSEPVYIPDRNRLLTLLSCYAHFSACFLPPEAVRVGNK